MNTKEIVNNEMDCFKQALIKASCPIPDWLPVPVCIDDMEDICKKLNLIWHGSGSIKLVDGIPYIVIINNKNKPGNIGHAEYTEKISDWLREPYTLVGVILFE